jgi:tetratricopeptide (TPR) repeat protein
MLSDRANTPQSPADQRLRQGDDWFAAGKFLAAAEHYNQALSLYRQNQDLAGEADTLLRLGGLYQRWGETFQQRAVELYRSLPPAETPAPAPDAEPPPWKRFPWKLPRLESVEPEPLLPPPPPPDPVA